jgi:hypothetical protein
MPRQRVNHSGTWHKSTPPAGARKACLRAPDPVEGTLAPEGERGRAARCARLHVLQVKVNERSRLG